MVVTNPNTVKEVVIGIQKTGTSAFYDWGVARLNPDGVTWTRTTNIPSVDPAPTCSGTTSVGITWEVKYSIRTLDGKDNFGVSPQKIDRVRDCAPPSVVAGSFKIDGVSLVPGQTITIGNAATMRVKLMDDSRISLARVKLTAVGIDSSKDSAANFALQNGLVGDKISSPSYSETFQQGMFTPSSNVTGTKWAVRLEIQDGSNPSVFIDGGFIVFS